MSGGVLHGELQNQGVLTISRCLHFNKQQSNLLKRIGSYGLRRVIWGKLIFKHKIMNNLIVNFVYQNFLYFLEHWVRVCIVNICLIKISVRSISVHERSRIPKCDTSHVKQ
jgi:hypothetical protein